MNSYVAERFARERFTELRGEAAGGLRVRLAQETNRFDPFPAEPSRESGMLTARRIIRRIIDAHQARRIGLR